MPVAITVGSTALSAPHKPHVAPDGISEDDAARPQLHRALKEEEARGGVGNFVGPRHAATTFFAPRRRFRPASAAAIARRRAYSD